MNDEEVKALVNKWNIRHDKAKEDFERKAKSMKKEEIINAFQKQMTCDDEGRIIGKSGLGPQNFNEYSVSAFAQEFKHHFKSDKILIAFGTNPDLKTCASLSANGIAGNAKYIDEAVPQPFISYIILNKDLFEYGLYLTQSSREEYEIVCFDSKGRQMKKKDLSQIDYLNCNDKKGVKAEHRKTNDKLMLKPKEREQFFETYATIMSNLIHIPGVELTQNSDIKFVQTSLNGCAHKLFKKTVSLSPFLNFNFVEEESKPSKSAKISFDGQRNQYLAKAIPFAVLKDASIIIGHNSVGSRVLVSERENTKNDYKEFSDEEIATLIFWWIITIHKFKIENQNKNEKKNPDQKSQPLVFNCGSDLLDKMSKKDGIDIQQCSTASEVIEKIIESKEDPSLKKLFFAFGKNDLFMCDPEIVTDWDGIGAAVNIAQLAIYLKAVNKCSLRNHLQTIQNEYKSIFV